MRETVAWIGVIVMLIGFAVSLAYCIGLYRSGMRWAEQERARQQIEPTEFAPLKRSQITQVWRLAYEPDPPASEELPALRLVAERLVDEQASRRGQAGMILVLIGLTLFSQEVPGRLIFGLSALVMLAPIVHVTRRTAAAETFLRRYPGPKV